MMTLRASLLLACLAGPAWGAGSCEELAAQIADKVRANGVSQFQIEIVPAELVVGDKVVGSCDRGRKKLTIVRGGAAPRPAAAASSVPRKP